MELKNFLQSLKRKQKIFWLIVGAVFMVSFIITFVQPLKFGTESQVLVSQNIEPGTDLYTISKSNEYLGNSLSKVISSNAFFNDTINTDFGIDKSYFSTDLKKQIELWRKTVDASTLSDSGIIVINVYHPDRYQAEQIARAINYTLKTKGANYFNSGSGLYVRVLDEPVVSTWPVKPNIAVNLLSGLLLGFALGLFYVYLISSDNQELVSILPDFKSTEMKHEATTHVVGLPTEVKAPVTENKIEPKVEIKTEIKEEIKPTIQVKAETTQAEVRKEIFSEPAKTLTTNTEAPKVIAPIVKEDKQFNDLIKQSDIKNVF